MTMDKLMIAGRSVGPGEPPWVIAEIGANHNGDMALCRRLIDAAHEAGADAVKFQSWSKASLISRAEFARNKTKYAKLDPSALTLEQSIDKYQFTPDQHREIAAYCRQRGITFFSSCFSAAEVELLESLDVPAYKIASMDVNYLPLLDVVAATRKPVILSTGMATLGEIERALDRLRAGGAGPVALLHCVSLYPCPPSTVHLRNIPMLQRTFGVPVGFSDHSLGAALAIAAVALGACILEKHFTVDKTLAGWDHAISADPADMSAIVTGARAVHEALGTEERVFDPAEVQNRKAFRRRAVARRALKRGARLTESDLDFKRPGNGIGPDEIAFAIGRVLGRDVEAEEELEWNDLG
jgi:N,N'-diacetyllegionaminate synthase